MTHPARAPFAFGVLHVLDELSALGDHSRPQQTEPGFNAPSRDVSLISRTRGSSGQVRRAHFTRRILVRKKSLSLAGEWRELGSGLTPVAEMPSALH